MGGQKIRGGKKALYDKPLNKNMHFPFLTKEFKQTDQLFINISLNILNIFCILKAWVKNYLQSK